MPNPTDIATQPAAGPSRARRRLLLGATGALPSVLTLSSGAALAAASVVRCVSTNQQLPERFTTVNDNWVRAQVRVGQFENRRAFCVTTPSSACVDSRFHAAPGSTWVVDGNTMTAGVSDNIRVLSDRAYGLVYVDQRGSVMTLNSAQAIDMHPVTSSCWTSVVGSHRSNLG